MLVKNSNEIKKIQILDFLRVFFSSSLIPVIEVTLMLMLIKEFQSSQTVKTSLVFFLKLITVTSIPISLFVFRRKFPSIKLFSFFIYYQLLLF